MRYESEYYGVVGLGDSLYHHGIKGQKWGVRRFQNPDGSLTPAGRARYVRDIEKQSQKGSRADTLREAHTIPKGTTIYRTTISESPDHRGPVYVSYIQADRDHYKAGWVRANAKANSAYEHTFTLTKDLKVPSRDELKEITNKIMKDNPELVRSTIEKRIDMLMPEGSEDRYYISLNKNEEYDPKEFRKYVNDRVSEFSKASMDDVFYQSAQTIGVNDQLKQKIIAECQNRGYNAITDEASVGGNKYGGKEGIDPLLVFDSSVLHETSTSKISAADEHDSMVRYNNWRRKAVTNRKSDRW